MQNVTIRIGLRSDREPIFPELQKLEGAQAEISHVGILEGGMQSGKASVTLIFGAPEDSKAEYVVCQMSAEMLASIYAAVKGACARFGQDLKP